MTGEEWPECNEPHKMLEYLRNSGMSSERKFRLFAVACSRRIWSWIDALGREAVEVAEKFADGFASSDELRAARLVCQGAGGQAAWYAAATNANIAARNSARSAQAGVARNPLLGSEAAELLAQAELVREIFGNPFRPISLDPSWRTPSVVSLAQTIYDERRFDRMPESADALAKVGCDNVEFLGHVRGPGPHVPGCWALDLALGKD
jgi:hypothetical protein